MESDRTISCPVCGRQNPNVQQCTFCGADLKGTGTTAAPAGSGPANAPPKDPFPRGDRYPSSPTEIPQPWGGQTFPLRFAGFWIRSVAYLIDSILIGLAMRLVQFGYLKGTREDFLGDSYSRFLDFDWSSLMPFVAIELLLTFSYFTFFVGRTGQTPGKMICGLKVIRLDGGDVTYTQAAMRTLGYYVSRLTLGLGFLWVAIDPRKQGFQDKIARTYVTRTGATEVTGWQPPPSGYRLDGRSQ